MIEIKGNIWDTNAEWICIPTNGVVDKHGNAVMGAGLAKQAADRCPEIKKVLGEGIRQHGNITQGLLWYEAKTLISFPTKNHWKDPSSRQLVVGSARVLKDMYVTLRNLNRAPKVALPRVGCGLGGLQWDEVKQALAPILDSDDFIVYY